MYLLYYYIHTLKEEYVLSGAEPDSRYHVVEIHHHPEQQDVQQGSDYNKSFEIF